MELVRERRAPLEERQENRHEPHAPGSPTGDNFLHQLDALEVSPVHPHYGMLAETPSPNSTTYTSNAGAQTSFGLPSMPSVPLHDPHKELAYAKSASETSRVPPSSGAATQSTSPTTKTMGILRSAVCVNGQTEVKDTIALGGEEEALEELEEIDEVEEMAEEHNQGGNLAISVEQTTTTTMPERMSGEQLADAVRAEGVALLQGLIRNMQKSPSSIKAGERIDHAQIDKLGKAIDELSFELSRVNVNGTGNEASVQKATQELFALYKEEEEDYTSGASHNRSIQVAQPIVHLLHALEPEVVRSMCSNEQPIRAVDPEPFAIQSRRDSTQTSSSGPRDTRSPRIGATRLGPPYAASLINSSPSSSREELRNPFAEADEEKVNSNSSDDRMRERFVQDDAVRFLSLLDELDKRIDGSKELQEESNGASITSTTTNSVRQGQDIAEDDTQSQATTLRKDISTCRSVLGARRAEFLSGGPYLSIQKRSVSPALQSPTFNLTSQRSSRAPSPMHNASSSEAIVVGDPMGEALVAGMGGIGAPRSLSRLSNDSRRNSVVFVPTAVSPSRRGSVRSENGPSPRGVHSPPPRYSAESTRSWASNTFPPLGASDAVEGATLYHGNDKARRESGSSDVTYGTGTIPPAYANEGDQMTSVDQKTSSNSSLVALSDTTMIGFRQMLAAGEKDPITKHSRIKSDQSIARTVPAMNPAYDLNMVQRSIDRMYEATPQLNDQRAGQPDPLRRASQREDDFARLMESMSKHGRLDDQRALPPTASSSRLDTVDSDRDRGHARAASSSFSVQKPKKFGPVPSLNFRSLSMRRASQLWENAPFRGGSGKGKERDQDDPKDEADLDFVASSLQAASSSRGMDDQRASVVRPQASMIDLGAAGSHTARDEPPQMKRSQSAMDFEDDELLDLEDDILPSRRKKAAGKLSKMGIEATNNDKLADDENSEDDDLFNALAASSSMRRMPNQDATLRENDSHKLVEQAKVSSQKGERQETNSKEVPSETITRTGESPSVGEQQQVTQTDLQNGSRSVPNIVDESLKEENLASSTDLTFIAETQGRLGLISVSLWSPRSVSNPSEKDVLVYSTQESEGATFSTLHVTQLWSTNGKQIFVLPALAQAKIDGDATVLQRHDCWSIRLAMSLPSTASDPPAVPFGADELNKGRPNEWQCSKCLQPIADTSLTKRYVPLPSQHWEELVDAWMCHADQELNETLVQAQKDLEQHSGIERGQAHVSDDCIVLSQSSLVRSCVHIEEPLVRCVQCRSALGTTSKGGAVKLFKFAIRPNTQTMRMTNGYGVPPLSAFIAHDLVRNAQVHATRRFSLETSPGDSPSSVRLALWLFLDVFDVALSPASDVLGKTLRSFTACKVMFKIDPEQKGTKAQGEEDVAAVNDWTMNATTTSERLEYPGAVCRAIAEVLEASNVYYPPSQRIFRTTPPFTEEEANPWRQGFLPFR